MEWPARLPPVGGGGVSHILTEFIHNHHVINSYIAIT